MILRDCLEQKDNLISENLTKVVGDAFSVYQFYSEEYDREYDVFKIESEKSNIILKKSKSKNEVLAHDILAKSECDFVPKIHYIEKAEEIYFIAMENLVNSKDSWSKDDITDLVEKLAYIHKECSKYQEGYERIRKWTYTSKADLEKLEDSEISKSHVEAIYNSQVILSESYQTFIHGDMIPLNMIITSEGVKIIDWEYGQFGPYILDLGRLLGDYNINQLWINHEWEEELLEAYYNSIKSNQIVASYNQFYLEYQCAKLQNYFEIVEAFKTRKWDRTDWYDMNLREMLSTINKINNVQTDSV